MSYLDTLLEKAQSSAAPAPGYAKSMPQASEYTWWEAAPDDADTDEEYVERARASSLFNCAKQLEAAQREIHQQNLWSAQLYSNRELAAFDWGTGQLYKASLAPISRTGENIAKRVVDTMVSQIGKNRPKPKPTPRGASWSCRRQVRLLDKFLYGTFQENFVYAKGKRIFRDGAIFGLGCMEVIVKDTPDGARVEYQRVFPDEVLIDQMEMVACGKLRHFYRRRALPIEVVASTYNIEEEELNELQNASMPSSYLDYRPVGRGWVIVIEGYQVASGDSPGRWMVATSNCVLDEGEWPHEWLPYVFYQYNDPVSGFYAPGVVEEALPYQIRLNEINEVIRDAQDLMGRPRVLIAEGSRVNPLEIDNLVGRFIKYTGIKPEAITWPAISAELYNERERVVRTCLENFGLSNLASTVTPPPSARFDSSAAFREFNAIQDDRLSDPAQRLEDFYRELSERTCQVVAASGKNVKTTWYSGYKKNKAETIDWDELEFDRTNFVMSMEMVSIYSMSPAAARDELEKQLAMGLITPEEYRLELADPDQESALTIAAAGAQDLNRVQELLEMGIYEQPIPEQDLLNGVTQMTLAMLNLNQYEDDGKGKYRLEDAKNAFLNWITEAKAILDLASEPSPTAGSEMPGMPMQPMQGMPPGMSPGMPLTGGIAGPAQVPTPEAYGLSSIAPGKMPNT